MKYVLIADYPYSTIKHFFETEQEATDFHLDPKDLLTSRIYELATFSKKERNGKEYIDYTVHLSSKKLK